ncbi:MAG TPA: glycosyltransferase family 4 protein [Pirellulales bacterium]|nr:glycosyltransferase family 4 protein [Pirellulales bacterium]
MDGFRFAATDCSPVATPQGFVARCEDATGAGTASCVGDLFPAAQGPVVILGTPQSMFPHQLARQWRSYGMDVRIVSHWPATVDVPFSEAPVLDARGHGSFLRRAVARFTLQAARRIEARLLKTQADRARRAVGQYENVLEISEPIEFAFGLSSFVRALKPQFVFGMEAFSYGLATAWCAGLPRILQPWGGDVYLFANTTSLANLVVTHALRRVDLLVPGSIAAGAYIQDRFGVPKERIQPLTYGADLRMFSRADDDTRRQICARYGIPGDSLIVMNVRRFLPLWGAEVALEAFVRFARARSDVHFVLLGGAGTEEGMARARQHLSEQGIADRFLLLQGDRPLAECAQLMSVADIGVSLMYNADMRSASVCQAAAAGAAMIVSEGAEFRSLEPLGFRAAFVSPGNVEEVLSALHRFADDPELRRESAESNRRYVERHEDWDKNHVRLLELIAGVCRRYRRGRPLRVGRQGRR